MMHFQDGETTSYLYFLGGKKYVNIKMQYIAVRFQKLAKNKLHVEDSVLQYMNWAPRDWAFWLC